MVRAALRFSWLWAAVTAGCAALAGWMYFDNRQLRAELQEARAVSRPEVAKPEASPPSAGSRRDEPGRGGLIGLARALSGARREPDTDRPADSKPESRMERRSRRSTEIAWLLGRADGETEAEYRERVMPLIESMLERPRQRAQEMRREAEAKAGVTPEQSAQVDEMLVSTYNELIEYTDAAIAEGQLSPYQRNVSGWLGYAGGLGGILSTTETKLGGILRPEQMRAMYDAGFEWGELIGVSAPWERLRPPPPPPR